MIKVREEPREVRRSGLPERLRYLLTDNPVKARDAVRQLPGRSCQADKQVKSFILFHGESHHLILFRCQDSTASGSFRM